MSIGRISPRLNADSPDDSHSSSSTSVPESSTARLGRYIRMLDELPLGNDVRDELHDTYCRVLGAATLLRQAQAEAPHDGVNLAECRTRLDEAISRSASFALENHAYDLSQSIVQDHQPVTCLALCLPADWAAPDARFLRVFDGVPVGYVLLAASDPDDPQAPYGGPLPMDLVQLASRMIEAGTTHEVTLHNAVPMAGMRLMCNALEDGDVHSFHYLPRFIDEEQLGNQTRDAASLFRGLGMCPHLTGLSVNCTALGTALSTEILGKGRLTNLLVDLWYPLPDRALTAATVHDTFLGLQECKKLESLELTHSCILPAALNTDVLPRLSGNQSIRAIHVESEVPLYGGGAAGIASLAESFELANTCTSLKTFVYDCPPAADCSDALVQVVHVDGMAAEFAQAGDRLAQALEKSRLLNVSMHGQVLHPIVAQGLFKGLGRNGSLEKLDLSDCSFLLNAAPQFIRDLMGNKTICGLAMPDPSTLMFYSESTDTYNNLVQDEGMWILESEDKDATADFLLFDLKPEGATFTAGFADLALLKVAQRNIKMRDEALRSAAAFNIGHFLGQAYKARTAPDSDWDPSADLFSIAGDRVLQELVASRSEETAVHLEELRTGMKPVSARNVADDDSIVTDDSVQGLIDEEGDDGAAEFADPVTALYEKAGVPRDMSELAQELLYERAFTPLQLSAAQWNVQNIIAFCEAGADVNAVNGEGDTALHVLLNNEPGGGLAAFNAIGDQQEAAECFLECAKALLGAGAQAETPNASGARFLERLIAFVEERPGHRQQPAIWDRVLREVTLRLR